MDDLIIYAFFFFTLFILDTCLFYKETTIYVHIKMPVRDIWFLCCFIPVDLPELPVHTFFQTYSVNIQGVHDTLITSLWDIFNDFFFHNIFDINGNIFTVYYWYCKTCWIPIQLDLINRWKWKFKKDKKIITFFLEGLLSRNSIFIYLQN